MIILEIKSLDVTDDGAGKLKLYTDYFVKAMNQTAKELKMNYTFFMNPHGLDTKEAYSCVHDLSILMSYIMS